MAGDEISREVAPLNVHSACGAPEMDAFEVDAKLGERPICGQSRLASGAARPVAPGCGAAAAAAAQLCCAASLVAAAERGAACSNSARRCAAASIAAAGAVVLISTYRYRNEVT